jgi:hypothetical protein
LALLAGSTVTTVFTVRDGRPALPGATVRTSGRIPTPADLRPALRTLGRPEAFAQDFTSIVAAAGTPSVTIDGRSSLNPQAIRVTASALLEAGGALAGPLPSDTVAVDLFIHELARQAPDVLVLTQPIAGDKLRLMTRFLGGKSAVDCLHVVYNGPAGYRHSLENLAGCAFSSIPSAITAGRATTGPTLQALRDLVTSHLGGRLAAAGFAGRPFESMGAAAARTALRLAGPMAPLARPASNRNGRNEPSDTRASLCFLVVEPAEATAFLPFGNGVDAASAGLVGTGTVDLIAAGRSRPTGAGAESWLPAWTSLVRRLPLDMEPIDAANLAGAGLVRPWAAADSEDSALVGAAMAEEILARLAAKWTGAVRRETNPARARVIVGTGYGLSRLGSVRLAASALIGGLEPAGVTVVAVDPWGASLLGATPEVAATCLSPLRVDHDWMRARTDPWAIVTLERGNDRTTLRRLLPGQVSAIPLGVGESGRVTIEPCLPKLDFGVGPGRVWRGEVRGGIIGLVLDGRGRPCRPPEDPVLRIAKRREFLAAFGVVEPAHRRMAVAGEEVSS